MKSKILIEATVNHPDDMSLDDVLADCIESLQRGVATFPGNDEQSFLVPVAEGEILRDDYLPWGEGASSRGETKTRIMQALPSFPEEVLDSANSKVLLAIAEAMAK